MVEVFALGTGAGFGLALGLYLGQRGGLRFVKTQLELAGQAAERMAQILVAPYGDKQVEQGISLLEQAFDDLNTDTERIPEWMDAQEGQEARATD